MNVFKEHGIAICKRTLRMNDVFVRIMGGPTKEEAREALRRHGWSESQIKALEEVKSCATR